MLAAPAMKFILLRPPLALKLHYDADFISQVISVGALAKGTIVGWLQGKAWRSP
jgi:hypothetical protein